MTISRFKVLYISLFLISTIQSISGQDIEYARTIVDTLCSPSMYGRGYVFDGDKIAASFLENEFKEIGLHKFNNDYKQAFKLSVNTFPNTIEISIDDKALIPSTDFYVAPFSNSIEGKYKVIWFNKDVIQDPIKKDKFMRENYSNDVVVVDGLGIVDEEEKKIIEVMKYNPIKAKCIVIIKDDKLSWNVSPDVANFSLIEINRNTFKTPFKNITLNVTNKFIDNYTTQNLIGYVEGSLFPDSFLVFTAHYDHLGSMGPGLYLPGANDNASGVALLMNLAKYYNNEENQPQYSIAFILLGAEEIGLLGSSYYVKNPLFPLSKIKFLVNMDLVGTGDEGIKVVNGTVYDNEFRILLDINNEYGYLNKISKRGEAAISDHYPFYKKGVKSVFIYTLGGNTAYHDLNDNPKNLTLLEYEDLFRLLRDFIDAIN